MFSGSERMVKAHLNEDAVIPAASRGGHWTAFEPAQLPGRQHVVDHDADRGVEGQVYPLLAGGQAVTDCIAGTPFLVADGRDGHQWAPGGQSPSASGGLRFHYGDHPGPESVMSTGTALVVGGTGPTGI